VPVNTQYHIVSPALYAKVIYVSKKVFYAAGKCKIGAKKIEGKTLRLYSLVFVFKQAIDITIGNTVLPELYLAKFKIAATGKGRVFGSGKIALAAF
jgi:hypothetical protein